MEEDLGFCKAEIQLKCFLPELKWGFFFFKMKI